jgi:hypothetical protein
VTCRAGRCPGFSVALTFRSACADPSLRSGQALEVGATSPLRGYWILLKEV